MSPAGVRPPVVVMGVSGSGKSTIGAKLADALGATFVDADSLHPQANKDKMAAGHPLDDDDRRMWLERVAAVIADVDGGSSAGVVACSALKRRYRDVLRSGAPDVFFAHLSGSERVIRDRLGHRHHEYMPASLLDSQFADLEPLGPDENGVVVDLSESPERILATILAALDD